MAKQILSKDSEAKIIGYINRVLTHRRQFPDYFIRLSALDVAYAAYVKKTNDDLNTDGLDIDSLLQEAIVNTKNTQIELVASHVNSTVAYLADIFLSGSPIFPVITDAKDSSLGERFEAVVQFHGRKSKYIRHLLQVFFDAAKYNICALDSYWDTMPNLLPDNAVLDAKLKFLTTGASSISLTKARRVDPYNLIWDYRKNPGDIAETGEFAGEVFLMGDTELKTLLNKFSALKVHRNVKDAQGSSIKKFIERAAAEATSNPGMSSFITPNYIQRPQISNFVGATANLTSMGWGQWMGVEDSPGANFGRNIYTSYSGLYEVVKLYAKIIPAELGIKTSKSNSPQVWEFWVVNGSILIYAEPRITAHGKLPITVGQLLEDGMSYQTKSIAERALPFQKTATDLLAVRVNSSKRAINDREYYDPLHIESIDINNPSSTAKIPVNGLSLGKTINDVVKTVPFNDRGTSAALVDMQATINLANNMAGINPFQQGQTQKGNRSASEFSGIIDFANLQRRLYALAMEAHIIIPLQDTIKLNLLLHQQVITAFDEKRSKIVELKPEELLDAIIEFKLADGYSPRAKLASTEDLQLAFQFINQSPELKGTYDISKLFAHLMSLRGVKELDQYLYSQDTIQAILAKAIPILQQMNQQQQQQGGTPNANQPTA